MRVNTISILIIFISELFLYLASLFYFFFSKGVSLETFSNSSFSFVFFNISPILSLSKNFIVNLIIILSLVVALLFVLNNFNNILLKFILITLLLMAWVGYGVYCSSYLY